MSTKTKTTAAAAIAALALPSAALGHDGQGKSRGHDRHDDTPSAKHRSDDRGERGQRGWHHGWHKGRRAFVLFGTDLAGLTVTDGKLAGPITLDPIAANAKARRLLELTKEKIAGEDTVEVGVAGDAVSVKYIGLAPTDAVQPTDVVKVFGKLDRKTGKLDLKKIYVKRLAADTDGDDDGEKKRD